MHKVLKLKHLFPQKKIYTEHECITFQLKRFEIWNFTDEVVLEKQRKAVEKKLTPESDISLRDEVDNNVFA